MSIYKSVARHKKRPEAQDETDAAAVDRPTARPAFRSRLLLLTSRGVTYRHRHLLNDLHALLPHSKKDAKLDGKQNPGLLVNELAELYNCNNALYFEARKARDLYLWLARPPNGPTARFHCLNIHTMEELHFAGNCLKGSRPVLSFDAAFDASAHARLLKQLLTHAFAVPQSSRRVKPFVDHVLGFTLADGNIWLRCYQIAETEQDKRPVGEDAPPPPPPPPTGDTNVSLVEIGPRLVLTPIVILEGSFGGPVIYENKQFVSPNQVRADLRRAKAGRHNRRAEGAVELKAKRRDLGLRSGEGVRRVDELDERVLFA